jgi:site-specific recombinase XerD
MLTVDTLETCNSPARYVELDARALLQRADDVSGATTDEHLVAIWLGTHNSDHTRRSYASDAVLLLDWLELRALTLRTLTVADLVAYVAELDGSPATRRRRVASVKSLLTFGRRTGYLHHDIGAVVKAPKADHDLAARILTHDEVRVLLDSATGRLRAILRLTYAAGLRISEALGLRWEHVHGADGGGAVLSVTGKGGKLRHVHIDDDTCAALGARNTSQSPVFATRDGGPLSASQIDREIKRLSKRTLGKPVSCHWLRHSHASHALDRGAPVHLVQATLGHASLATTGRYAHARPTASSGSFLGLAKVTLPRESRGSAA